MGFNSKKTCNKIREELEKQGHKKDIPFDVFGIATMKVLGTNKKPKAAKWINTFELFGYIEIQNKKVNFIDETGGVE